VSSDVQPALRKVGKWSAFRVEFTVSEGGGGDGGCANRVEEPEARPDLMKPPPLPLP